MNPDDFTFIDLFAGIGGIRIAFERAGGKCVWSCDWDVDAQNMYEKNFGELPFGDVRKIHSKDIPDHDVLLAGFPCPSFSILGNRNGFKDDEGSLFFEIERILRDKKPSAFMLENVKGLANIDGGEIIKFIVDSLEKLSYSVHWDILNALDSGLPQKRERVIIVGFQENYKFSFRKKTKKRKSLSDILEDDDKVGKSYWASKRIRKKRLESVKNKKVFYPSVWHENKSGNISVHPFSCALRANASHNYLLVNGVRRLTPHEMARLQGFPEDFKLVGNSYSTFRKLFGNSVPVPMIEEVAKQMMKSIREGIIIPKLKQIKLAEVI
jgi:DNA (cytosine-5)-methyltransferase 1